MGVEMEQTAEQVQKLGERERIRMEQSGEWAESAAHNPLTDFLS